MSGHTALVTGGSSGIGAEICRQMLDAGYEVVSLSLGKPEHQHARLHSIDLDLTDAAATRQAAAEIAAQFYFTHFVHNAGAIRPAALADVKSSDLEALSQLHLGAAITLAHPNTTIRVSGQSLARLENASKEASLRDHLWINRRNATLSQSYGSELSRMAGTVTGLDSALASAKAETDALRARLQRERDDDPRRANVDEWSRRVAQAEQRHQRLALAASMDAPAIAAANGRAVALVAVEMPDGKAYSGTGFAVTSDGLVVTNRHLTQDERGQPVRRVMVIFSDTQRWLPAHVVKTSASDDIALLQIDVAGPFPTVSGIARSDAATVGSPVVLIGYPLGTSTAGMNGDVSHITARSTLGVGTVSKRLPEVLQVDAYAGEGSSGSPVFDAQGRVIGVVYGGATESGGRIVYAVPGARLAAQLPPGIVAVR